jgi:hypothetical protein
LLQVRAGEAWWTGRDELFSTLIDKMEPPSLDLSEAVSKSAIRSGAYRDGIAWDAKEFSKADPITRHYKLWKTSKMIELASVEATERAEEAMARMEKHLETFRGRVGNDLTSMKAASQRVQTEVATMSEKYVAARDLLTSPDFERAIANAERMAAALKSISELSETKLSVAVFNGGSAKPAS